MKSFNSVEPNHYKNKKPEPIDVIVGWDLNFIEGCIIKYISRYKDKNGLEDLYKAKWYMDKLIELKIKEDLDEAQKQEAER